MPQKSSNATTRTIEPQLATLVDSAPRGDAWLHEIKFDGYRLLCHIAGGVGRLISRNAKDWTEQFPEVITSVIGLGLDSAVLDGEVAILRPDGTTSFQDLQNAVGGGHRESLRYFLFDLLQLDGEDWTARPLIERKERLAALLAGQRSDGVLLYSDHVVGNGPAFYRQACAYGLEGIISKRKDAPYRSGRSRDWQKVKCLRVMDFVVGGFTAPGGSRPGFGALLIGGYDGAGRLRFGGRVGTGFKDAQLVTLHKRLESLRVDLSPFFDGPEGRASAGLSWVKPVLVAEVAFVEWTDEGIVRHPSFRRIREDVPADSVRLRRPDVLTADVRAAEPVEASASSSVPAGRTPSTAKPVRSVSSHRKPRGPAVAGIAISNPEKVMYPDAGITKLEVASYYGMVAERMTPLISGRPLTLVRCPMGIADCFYQKHVEGALHASVRKIRISEDQAEGDYALVDSPTGIVALAQLGVLEFHTWGAREAAVEQPDRFTLDLDPDPDLPWIRVVEAALDLRGLLRELGLVPFVKTTGGKGLHIVVPIVPRESWETVKEFSRRIAAAMDEEWPRRYTLSVSKERRKGRILIDYLRNGRGATAVEAYSTRARPGATVSAPITWNELTSGVRPDAFTLRNMPERLSALDADPWHGYEAAARTLSPPMLRAVGLDPGSAGG
ncbi:MAG: DNA ligase D [Gemmatimonadetes bacterium]|nr:DNA ligase D [Gemmatimonadota bacterium]